MLQAGQRCHQHPCTKTANFDLGYTKSGLPGSRDRTIFFRNSRERRSSGVVPDALFERMDLDTRSEDAFGAGPTGLVRYLRSLGAQVEPIKRTPINCGIELNILIGVPH
jgi:hypothetical protein